MNQRVHWGSSGRMPALVLLGTGIATMLAAQAPVQYGVFYMCPGGNRFKVYACSGNEPNSPCDTQAFSGAQPGQRGPAPRGQVQALLQVCHVQTAAEEKSAASGGGAVQAPPAQASSNGIKVGDAVEVVTGFGWTPAKVLAIQGNNYRVLTNGVQVTKTYPSEVRRLGGATAGDHAAGQYRLGDRVQVNVNGQWMEGKVITELGQDYQVQFGDRTVWANGPNLRPSTAPPPPGPLKAGTAPKQGMASCAGKIEGRYSGSGLGTVTITFRSGKATLGDMLGGETVLECWFAGDKIILREAGKPELDMPIDINNDGTLQTPLWGELKKKGN
jgi:hypothetical protein